MTFDEWIEQTGLDPVDAWWVLALAGAKLPEPTDSTQHVLKEKE